MEGYRKSFALKALLLCLLSGNGLCSQIIAGPSNATVLTGSDAKFMCTVEPGWQSLTWVYKGTLVATITSTQVIIGDPQIRLQNSTNTITGAFSSEITIVNVDKSNSGVIQCNSLSSPFKEAYLSVQVNGTLSITNGSLTVFSNNTIDIVCRAVGWSPAPHITWEINNTLANNLDYVTEYTIRKDDLHDAKSILKISPQGNVSITCLATIETLSKPQSATVEIILLDRVPDAGASTKDNTTTIIIAVVVPVGVVLILIIIIVTIVCCRKKKKHKGTSYQSDAWKTTAKNTNDWSNKENNRFGEVNYGYSSDSSTTRPPLPSTPPTNPNSVTYMDSASQVPGSASSDAPVKKIRHVTHV